MNHTSREARFPSSSVRTVPLTSTGTPPRCKHLALCTTHS